MHRLKVIVLITLILISLDLGLGQFAKYNFDFWKNAYPPTDHRIRSEDFHHGLAPNRDVFEAWGLYRYRYHTNSLGFKDAAPRVVPLKSDKKRLLFLGDSFTEGKGFAYPETFVGRIADKLSPQGVEVLNAGVDSYAPVIYRLKAKYLLEKVKLKVDAVAVFVDVSDVYDEANRYTYDAQGRLMIPPKDGLTWKSAFEAVRDNSLTVRLVSVAYDHLNFMVRYLMRRRKVAGASGKSFSDVTPLDLWADSMSGQKVAAWTYDDARWRAHGKLGRERAARNMDGLLALLRQHGIPLTIAVYPWPEQLFNDPKAPRYRDFWRDWAKQRDVPFIDLFPAFTQAPPQGVLKKYFIPFDFHWNAAGHDLVAKTFLEQFMMPK
ncbi:MAG: SGNH/GDSL hydrolase family protein [Rhodospirillales bacterium]|nr:SGNH/GDSL hydrolase family protein [Rhodospirillales bacterium]